MEAQAMTKPDQEVRRQLVALLTGGHAHMGLEQAVGDFPKEQRNQTIPGLPYTPWHLLEHMRIAQWDILEFIRNPGHKSPEWPRGYWPPRQLQADQAQWEASLCAWQADLKSLVEIVEDAKNDLYSDLPHAPGYCILREMLVVSDHNAYHLGELAALKTVMG